VNVDVTIPELAESITEAIVGDWLKSPGEHVEEGDLLVDVETDKVVLEITAPKSGELALISKHKNEIVQSNEVIAVINTNKTSSGSSDDLTMSAKSQVLQNMLLQLRVRKAVPMQKQRLKVRLVSQLGMILCFIRLKPVQLFENWLQKIILM